LELHRHKEDIIWGACEHDGRPQLWVEDTTATQTYVGINSNNSPNMRTIASYTTRQFVRTSYDTSLIFNDSINQRSDTGRSIRVNDGTATDVIIMDGHVLVTSGTDTQQHRHCNNIIIGGMLLRHEYIHPTDMKSVTRLFDYGEIPTSDDIDISTITDSKIDGYMSNSTGHGTSSSSVSYDMDGPNSISVSNGLHYVALSSDDKNGESRMIGASCTGIGWDVSIDACSGGGQFTRVR